MFRHSTGLLQAAYLFLLSLVAIAVDGYHPFSEDAGIYVAGIKNAVHPGTYGSSAAFIMPYMQLSLFSRCNAWLVRSLHLHLESVLFAMQIGTTWLLLYACWGLAKRCFDQAEARWGAVVLVALCLQVPVAGTSLFLMDPYLTGRSFSTPFALLAVCACLDNHKVRCALYLVLAALFHPLMSIYAVGFVLLLWAIRRQSYVGIAALIAGALAAGGIILYSQKMVAESTAYQAAVASRYYFFLSRWQWYEVLGLVAPLILLWAYCVWAQDRAFRAPGALLAQTCIAIGITSIAGSLLYATPMSRAHFISGLQPLRAFLFVYYVMFLLLGGLMGRYLMKRAAWRWAALIMCVGAGLGYAQHLAYGSSAHVEVPWMTPRNEWYQAFLWIRQNTSPGSLVALDANYIHARGEDAQGFRAIAERASLADQAKDGGAAAVFPQLADRWMTEQTATTNLNGIRDEERLRRLVPLHVDWVVLERGASTSLECPYLNNLVKVCRLHETNGP